MIDLWATLHEIEDLGRHAETAFRDKDERMAAFYIGMIAGVVSTARKQKPQPQAGVQSLSGYLQGMNPGVNVGYSGGKAG